MQELSKLFAKNDIANVVPYQMELDTVEKLNLSTSNTYLTKEIYENTNSFGVFINTLINGATYGYGGYLEKRDIYKRSSLFANATPPSEERNIHLGIDIWGAADTPVMAPISGKVHSKGYHPEFGNYGGTIILEHTHEHIRFYTLYGHLALHDVTIEEGTEIEKGTAFAHIGTPQENGNWPPHLHFQVILDLQGKTGDYPGVCAASELSFYMANCPDPAFLLPW